MPWKRFCAFQTTNVILIATLWMPQIGSAADAELVSKIDTYLTASVPRGLSAAVLIAKDGKPLIAKGYGLADRAKGTPNTPDTVFDIGSLTKQFTAAAILKLVERKKLSLTDPLGKYFENRPKDKRDITLHQLLTHSAGFQEYPANDFDAVAVDQYLDFVFKSTLQFKAGERYSYSNVGYALLGFIIERVSGMTYEQYLSRTFFLPLNMRHTGYILPDWNRSAFAHGYAFDFFDWGTSIERYGRSGVSPVLMGNGGINSTLTDLQRWLASLSDASTLSPTSLEALFTPHMRMPDQNRTDRSNESYAYGWIVRTNSRGTRTILHSGDNGNFRATILLLPDEQTTLVYLSNNGDRTSFGVPYEIEKMLFNETYSPQPLARSPYRVVDEFVQEHPSSASGQLLGHYTQEMGSTITDKRLFNRLGLLYAREGKERVQWGVELLKLNVKLFPNDGNLRDSLGEGYLVSDQPKLAVDSFRQALSLAPATDCNWCKNSREKLRLLDADATSPQ